MINPRWRKVWHDLWGNKVRSLLVITTIAVGVFAIGFVSDMLFVAVPTMDGDYLKGDPHSAIIYPDPFRRRHGGIPAAGAGRRAGGGAQQHRGAGDAAEWRR